MVLKLAAVEGGGTTFVVAIAHDEPTNIVERAEFPTTTPAETLGKCCQWLSTRTYDSLGVATGQGESYNKRVVALQRIM